MLLAARRFAQKLGFRNLNLLPVLLGLALIAGTFEGVTGNFLSPLNITNLVVQISAVGIISIGVVLALLIGEIDLSLGSVSGLCAAIMAVASVKLGVPGFVAVLAAIAGGAVIGILQGWWVARIGVPSFVVTLAGLVGWQGAQLWTLGSTGTINLNDPLIIGLVNTRLPVWLGWMAGCAFVALYAATHLWERRRRRLQSLPHESLFATLIRSAVVLLAVCAVVGVMSVNRNPNGDPPITGMPTAVAILLGLVIVFDYVTRRTVFGRNVFAVGGNAEGARRAGIAVERIRIAVFVLAASLAAVGGIVAGSRLFAVSQSTGGGETLLNSIAAAVIGGTSLFGGRGSIWSAPLGALVIGSIANGMDLLAFPSSARFMVTGAVLLGAVTIDSAARARAEPGGSP